MLKLVLLHLGWLGAGLLALEMIASGQRVSVRRLIEAYFAGLALHVVVLYGWAALAPVPIVAARALIGSGLAMGLVWLVRRWRAAGADRAGSVAHRKRARLGLIDLVLAAQLAPPLLLIVFSAWCVPLHHWDPLAIWSAKAGLLFHGEFLRSEAFVNPDWLQPHQGYPIGYAIVLFEHAAAAGRCDELMMNRGLILTLATGLLLLGVLMSEWAGRRMAMATLGLLLWTPAVWQIGFAGAASSGYADLPLGLCAALAAGLFVRGLTTRDLQSLAAGSATLILALSFKNEGLLWTVLICGLGLATVAFSGERRNTGAWLALTTPLAALVLLRLAHSHLPTSSDVAVPSISEAIALLALAPRLATLAFAELIADPSWGVLRLFLPVALVIGLVRASRQPIALLGLAAPLYLMIALAVLGLTEVQWQAMEVYAQTMFPRLIIQLLPSALLFAVVLNSQGRFPIGGRRGADGGATLPCSDRTQSIS